MIHSVNRIEPATEAAFCKANLVTLVGSKIPDSLRLITSPVSTSIPAQKSLPESSPRHKNPTQNH